MAIQVRLLRQHIAAQAGKAIASRANAAARLDFDTKKKEFLDEFDAHPVTQEIEAGPHADSSFISTNNGGNLFSLLGFYQEQRPIPELRDYLDEHIKLDTNQKKITVQGERILVETPVSIPTVAEVDAAMAANQETHLEWTDRPFTSLISKGITGFGHYVAGMFDPPSRSGGGYEVKKDQGRSSSLRPIPYVGALLKDLKSIIRGRG